MKFRNCWAAPLALMALLGAAPAAAEVYKCRTPDGRVEIANMPCQGGASTLKTLPDEKVSEADRLHAEHEAERMRTYVDQREAVLRAEEAAERERQRQQAPYIYSTNSPVDECLRDLDRQALSVQQRQQMEAACTGTSIGQAGYGYGYSYLPWAVPVTGRLGMPLHRPLLTHVPNREPLLMLEAPKTTMKPQAACPPNGRFCMR